MIGSKKRRSILARILIISLLILFIGIIASYSNKSNAVGTFDDEKNINNKNYCIDNRFPPSFALSNYDSAEDIYCIKYGATFHQGTHYSIENKEEDFVLAYGVIKSKTKYSDITFGTDKESNGGTWQTFEQNYVWEYFSPDKTGYYFGTNDNTNTNGIWTKINFSKDFGGTGSHARELVEYYKHDSTTFNKIKSLRDEAIQAKKLVNHLETNYYITLKAPTLINGVVPKNEKNVYGPFTYNITSNNKVITLNYTQKDLFETECKGMEILINEKKVTPVDENANIISRFIKPGEKFYIKENALNLGQENKMSITYLISDYKCKVGIYSYNSVNYSNTSTIQPIAIIKPYTEIVRKDGALSFRTGYPKITISGKVWLDGQTGIKPVKEPNGLYNYESLLNNIKVYVKRKSDNKIVQTAYTTNGKYEFTNLDGAFQAGDNEHTYYIEFEYDGINYIATSPRIGLNQTIDSDGYEVERVNFNNKFKTIVKNTAINANGVTKINLVYDTTTNYKKATLITKNGNEVKNEFKMRATTAGYWESTSNIDLGLVKRGVDLAAATEIAEAVVKINGKEQHTYNYNDISINNNIVIGTNSNYIKYSLNLYKSDYNYRIGDYRLQATRSNEQYIEKMQNARQSDGELEVVLTYKVVVSAQSSHIGGEEPQTNELAYYFDPRLKLNAKNAKDEDEKFETTTIQGVEYNKVIINQDFFNKYESSKDSKKSEITINFTVKKDENGAINLGDFKNWVEITSYSTSKGYIDIDSAPDNIEKHATEDDSDNATALNIQVIDDDRTIQGCVFEDINKDGLNNNEDKKVSDVIVQLIEIKNVEIEDKIHKLEYIWQETRTNSDEVKAVNIDGTGITTYNNNYKKEGEYKFENFIPGDYIVRFIYGDGTYFDVSSNEGKANIIKYNGQDYKSTIDSLYREPIFNGGDTKYVENASMARDNEARRLEEMSYATNTERTADELRIDDKADLENTWMCAETSTVMVPIENTNQTINFGLMQRAKIGLKLEKHVTGLQIKSNDTTNPGQLIKAYVTDIDNYFNDNGDANVITEGEALNIKTVSNKTSGVRGQWLLDTQRENIAGKRIDITYGYKITKTGKEYISKTLLDYLKNKTEKEYSTVYTTIADEAKKKMQIQNGYVVGEYLGTSYYTGEQGEDLSLGITVQIEDYLKPGLLNIVESDDFKVVNSEEKRWIWTSDRKNDGTLTAAQEKVNVIHSKSITLDDNNEEAIISLNVFAPTIDTTNGKELYRYSSYAAQLISGGMKTTPSGAPIMNATLGNLNYVQAIERDTTGLINYSSLGTKDNEIKNDGSSPKYIVLKGDNKPLLVPEDDEFIAETIEITVDTGSPRKEQK